jgi:hypothetical protein
MTRSKATWIFIFVMALTFIGFAGRRSDSVRTLAAKPQAPTNTVPDHVTYRMLFHHVHVLQESATKAEQQGNYHSALAYRRAAFAADAQLNEEQTQALVRLAEACELAVRSIDQRAKKIIDARRQHFQKTGVVLPPSELLEALEAERNRTILFYRDQLGASLGEKEWSRFRGFVQERVVPNITTTGSSHNSRQEPSQAN